MTRRASLHHHDPSVAAGALRTTLRGGTQPMASDRAIELRGVTKQYRRDAFVIPVLNDLSLGVP